MSKLTKLQAAIEEMHRDKRLIGFELMETVNELLPTLPPGIWDTTDVPFVELDTNNTKLEKKVREVTAFFKKYPAAVYAQGYEANNSFILAWKPKKVGRINDSREFTYSTINFDTNGAKRLLFNLDH